MSNSNEANIEALKIMVMNCRDFAELHNIPYLSVSVIEEDKKLVDINTMEGSFGIYQQSSITSMRLNNLNAIIEAFTKASHSFVLRMLQAIESETITQNIPKKE